MSKNDKLHRRLLLHTLLTSPAYFPSLFSIGHFRRAPPRTLFKRFELLPSVICFARCFGFNLMHSDDNFDVLRAEKILGQDHYGLSDVKERILEFIVVGNLEALHKIICHSGPRGVGKTNIACSIARVLAGMFFYLSVGGPRTI